MVFRLCKHTSWTYKWRTKSTSDHIMLVLIHVPLQNCQLYSLWKVSRECVHVQHVVMVGTWSYHYHKATIYGNIYTGTTLRCMDIGSKDWINMLQASLHNQSWLSTVLPYRTQWPLSTYTVELLLNDTPGHLNWLIGHLMKYQFHFILIPHFEYRVLLYCNRIALSTWLT